MTDDRSDPQSPLSSSGSAAPSVLPSHSDSVFDVAAGAPDQPLQALPPRLIGWRLRLLVACALLGCLTLFALTRMLAEQPRIAAAWRIDAAGRIELVQSTDPALQQHLGKSLLRIAAADGDTRVELSDALALQRSPRWLVDDAERARLGSLHESIAAVLAYAPVRLTFTDGISVDVMPSAPGYRLLPALYWLLTGFALALYLVAAVAVLGQPSTSNALYGVMAWCQAGNLTLIAIEVACDFGLPAPWAALDLPLRTSLDLFTAAAMVHAACLRPRRLPHAAPILMVAWIGALGVIGAALLGALPRLWWWIQGTATLYGVLTIVLLSWSYRLEPHPLAIVLRRLAVVGTLTWALLTLALGTTARLPETPGNLAALGSLIWYVFFGSLLLVLPFLTRPQLAMREFSLLAAVCTVATSLDLLFIAVFALGPFASLILSLALALAAYAAARQWILNQLLGSSVLTTERMFEQIYRIAREIEVHPDRIAPLMSQLLREIFEPIENQWVDRFGVNTRLAGDGSSLLVPVPSVDGGGGSGAGGSILIRFAHRGRRLFTLEDARLADRIGEQLRRAMAFEQAVEHGRREERLRLAQDLHDDIGARLLTMMYTAQSPQMEDYLRHTLQDLKTLTRGLAASNHRLSHSAAEWKSTLAQRLTAARIELKWSFSFDEDVVLNVVQWSALTRVLRELISNTIAHAHAQRVEIDFVLERGRLELTVSDNGVGTDPQAWAHGLGLGGIRKRVKQLGGEVEWRTLTPNGISCRVSIREFSAPR